VSLGSDRAASGHLACEAGFVVLIFFNAKFFHTVVLLVQIDNKAV
jgi:hypothetical protein